MDLVAFYILLTILGIVLTAGVILYMMAPLYEHAPYRRVRPHIRTPTVRSFSKN